MLKADAEQIDGQSRQLNVRFGSKADIGTCPRDVPFTRSSGHQTGPRYVRRSNSGSLAIFAAIRRASLHGLQTATFKSYRGGSFRVVPCARWHAPCVMASLTGLLDHATADNESKHNNESE